MLIKLTIRNFKRFGKVDIELGNPVVFIGPNNSGKTSALQALALWEVGLKRWNEKRKGRATPEKRPGVTINRRDLIAAPVPDANLLWRNLHVRDIQKEDGKQATKNIRIEITVEGVTNDRQWKCGLEFDYANEESIYCRPIRLSKQEAAIRMAIPDEAGFVRVAFLPPMSGLMASETHLDQGAINVRIGEGRTAEVLRNLCFMIHETDINKWRELLKQIKNLFGVDLEDPQYIPERGEITMTYLQGNTPLDLSSSGRGLQQTMLVLAYMYANPGAVLLLDEPDAHLEILRQRQIYQLLTDIARDQDNQIIAASHSEVLLAEAGRRDVVVGFVGKPHRIDDRGSQVAKALKDIGFEDYYLAEATGWVLYLEGSTDLAILRSFARKIKDTRAIEVLERPFVKYVENQPGKIRDHFHGVKEAVPKLQAVAIFDRLDRQFQDCPGLEELMWKRREIENYLCFRESLVGYARGIAVSDAPGPLFAAVEEQHRIEAMSAAISEVERALETLGKGTPWGPDMKVSDEFLTPVFEKFFKKLGLPNVMAKKNFHELAHHVPAEMIDQEVIEKLDAIVRVAGKALPAKESDDTQ